jgi:hypothetical protein
LISAANAAAVIAAGLLSVLLFPLAALALLRSAGQPQRQPRSGRRSELSNRLLLALPNPAARGYSVGSTSK